MNHINVNRSWMAVILQPGPIQLSIDMKTISVFSNQMRMRTCNLYAYCLSYECYYVGQAGFSFVFTCIFVIMLHNFNFGFIVGRKIQSCYLHILLLCKVIFYDGNCLCICYHTFAVINSACSSWVGYHISS